MCMLTVSITAFVCMLWGGVEIAFGFAFSFLLK
jgi:hypothetical protein